MGCSNPHPHGQIWASSFLPSEPTVKDTCQRKYYEKHGRALLMDYVQQEIERNVSIAFSFSKIYLGYKCLNLLLL